MADLGEDALGEFLPIRQVGIGRMVDGSLRLLGPGTVLHHFDQGVDNCGIHPSPNAEGAQHPGP